MSVSYLYGHHRKISIFGVIALHVLFYTRLVISNFSQIANRCKLNQNENMSTSLSFGSRKRKQTGCLLKIKAFGKLLRRGPRNLPLHAGSFAFTQLGVIIGLEDDLIGLQRG